MEKIAKRIGRSIDIVWSFDLGYIYPLSFFRKSLKIFHPVDEPLNQTAIHAIRDAIFFSVTNEILEKYKDVNVPRHFINHGVAEEFFLEKTQSAFDNKIRVGISGNFTRQDIEPGY